MDKYEYKLRSEEIKSLISERDFVKAVEIADTIDWSRVRSVSMLCTISDLYKVNRRYNEAKEILTQAYERYPVGRTILYSLCELCIKTDDIVRAIEYYKKFVQLAPTDNGKFVLQYKIYEAQDVSIEERIAVLEELKKREYREKWGYELAYLYHRIGLTTKCIEECDELIIWFREGRYVKKAMELKMLHQTLTPQQENLYKGMLPATEKKHFEEQTKVYDSSEVQAAIQNDLGQTKVMDGSGEMEIKVKPVDVGKYNTINLQKELAKSMKEVLVTDNSYEHLYQVQPSEEEIVSIQPVEILEEETTEKETTEKETTEEIEKELTKEIVEYSSVVAEEIALDKEEEVGDATEAEVEFEREILSAFEEMPDNIYKPVGETKVEFIEPEETEVKSEKVDPREARNTSDHWNKMAESAPRKLFKASNETEATMNNMLKDVGLYQEEPADKEKVEYKETEHIEKNVSFEEEPEKSEVSETERPSIREVMEGKSNSEELDLSQVNPPENMGHLLSQEYNGQISMVVPDEEIIEKQITGQMNLEDILQEWEKTKKKNEEKRKRETTERVLAQTGTLFTEFEARIRDGILEKLEKGEIDIESIRDKNSTVIADAVKEALNKKEFSDDDQVEELEEIKEYSEEEEELSEKEEEKQNISGVEEENSKTAEVVENNVEAKEVSPKEVSLKETADVPRDEKLIDESIIEDEIHKAEHLVEENTVKEVTVWDDSTEAEEKRHAKHKKTVREENSLSEESNKETEEEEERTLSEEEIELFAPFIQTKNARMSLVKAIDAISLSAYTGNVFVTGETQEETAELAKNVIREVQLIDRNFSGKVAKVTGSSLNNRDIDSMINRLTNGGLIIEKASGMDTQTTKDLLKTLNQEQSGIVVVLQDTKKARLKMMEFYSGMKEIFNVHIEVEELGDDALVAYGKKYARHLEYAIDELGVLALHTRIDRMQTADHVVTVADVRDIIDEAIESTNRKTFKHFTEILLSKRYDNEDMIILKERDFLK